MKKVPLTIVAIAYRKQFNATLTLKEEEGRLLPIEIGVREAESIAVGFDKTQLPRPLTHDLFAQFLTQTSTTLVEVVIHRIHEGNNVFYANIVFQQDGNLITSDARPSDAIALAVRCFAPILATEEVVEQWVKLTEGKTISALSPLSLSQLKEQLKKAVEEEDYEQASVIRDEIIQREGT